MTKRLYKSQNRMIAGVCAGLAEYFNFDPTIVRLIFVVLLFALWAVIIPAYIIGMIIIPDRPFSSNDQYRYEEDMKSANDYDSSDEDFAKYFKKGSDEEK
ncbi:MAG: PspC domain-containing protein [Spirochaetaceae bacterium]|nr:PspC domain-containing protein [Spirochaetaceae bacterium]